MTEFTRSDNRELFRRLKDKLDASPGTTFVYSGIQLPSATCNPAVSRLGFKAIRTRDNRTAYQVYIDHITYTGSNYLFRQWVIDGDWCFADYDSMITFFHTQLKHLDQ